MLTDKAKKAIASYRKLYGRRWMYVIDLVSYFLLFLISAWIVIGSISTMHKYVDNELRYEMRQPEEVISSKIARDIHKIYREKLFQLIGYTLLSVLWLCTFASELTSKWWFKIVDKLSSEERAVDCYINLP